MNTYADSDDPEDVKVIRVHPYKNPTDLEIFNRPPASNRGPSNQENSNSDRHRHMSYVRAIQGFDQSLAIFGRMSAFHPIEYQNAMGGPSFYSLGSSISVEYRNYLTEQLFLLFKANNYNTQGSVGSSQSYQVSGYILTGGLGYILYDSEDNIFGISLGILGGGSYSEASNSNSSSTLNQKIISYSAASLIMIHWYILKPLGLNFNLGYAYSPLGNISTLTQATSGDASPINMDMSTPLVEIGLGLRF